jgi:phage terminase large subunit-like protein
MTSLTDRTTRYAQDVDNGIIPAGSPVRAACRRHLRDLRDGSARGFRFDVAEAERAFKFWEKVLVLNGGQFEGKAFELLPWQCFIIGSLFGWKREDGSRRFRMAFVETAKGSGKSPLAAGVALKCLVSDKEPRAEIYSGASKKDQAMILFRDAVAAVRQSPDLAKRLDFSGGFGNEWSINYKAQTSFFRPISNDDGKSGPRPHCAVIDEVHEHRDDSMVEMMIAGTKFRRNPLIFMITNSGTNRHSVCWNYHQMAIKVSEGLFEDDSFFGYVCALDDDDDPFEDESCWIKVNPSLGVTIQMDYLRRQVKGAKGMPSRENLVKRLNFCVWTDSIDAWVDLDKWNACEKAFEIDEMRTFPCVLGLDLSSKRDLTALSAVWTLPDGRRAAKVWCWTPEETLAERANSDSVPYATWVDEGHLFTTPGRLIDKIYIARFIKNELAPVLNIVGMAFDPAMIDEFIKACDEEGLEVVEYGTDDAKWSDGIKMIKHGQGWSGLTSKSLLWMPRSISKLEELVMAEQIDICRNPVLRWASGSAVLVADPSNNRKWEKRKSAGRIDPVVALTQAVGASYLEDLTGSNMNENFEVTIW